MGILFETYRWDRDRYPASNIIDKQLIWIIPWSLQLYALRSSYDYSTRSEGRSDEDDLNIGNMVDRRNMIPSYINSNEQDGKYLHEPQKNIFL